MEELYGHFPPSPEMKETARRDRTDYRHWLLRHLQRLLYFAGVEGSLRGCLQGTFERWDKKQKTLVNRAEIHWYGNRAHWVGVAHCKDALCPVCGPIIAARRLDEAKECAEKLLAAGYSYLFPTFTASHGPDVSLAEFIKKFKAAWKDFYNSAEYKWLKRHGLAFAMNANETTDDDPGVPAAKRTGWHFHRHSVLWFDSGGRWQTVEEVEKIREKLLSGWRKSLEKHGLSCSDERGVYIQTIQRFAEKTGKEVPFDESSFKAQKKYVNQVVTYVSKSLGFEMTGTGRKTSKKGLHGGARVSHWELMERAILGDKRAKARFLELFETYHTEHVNSFRLSQGLAAFCGIKEKSDEQLLSEGEVALPLVIFGPKDGYDHRPVFESDDWLPFAKQGRMAHLADLVGDSFVAGRDPVSEVRLMIDCANAGLDILTDKWLPPDGLSRVWEGLMVGMVANVKPTPAESERIEKEAQAVADARRQAEIDDWLWELDKYDDSIIIDHLNTVLRVRRNPELYSAGSLHPIAEKRAAWHEVAAAGCLDEMISELNRLGYLVPPQFVERPAPVQADLLSV